MWLNHDWLKEHMREIVELIRGKEQAWWCGTTQTNIPNFKTKKKENQSRARKWKSQISHSCYSMSVCGNSVSFPVFPSCFVCFLSFSLFLRSSSPVVATYILSISTLLSAFSFFYYIHILFWVVWSLLVLLQKGGSTYDVNLASSLFWVPFIHPFRFLHYSFVLLRSITSPYTYICCHSITSHPLS